MDPWNKPAAVRRKGGGDQVSDGEGIVQRIYTHDQ